MQVLPAPDCVTILTVPKLSESICPLCAVASGRVHSHYTRTLADLPWQGRRAAIQVRARRFRCATTDCPRRVFAERLPDVAQPRARRSVRLGSIQRHIGFALGGEPGARLAARLAMPVSGDTLLRLVRASTLVASPPPRVIGVDDWAWRRGRRYGTIICDLERRRVIDLLPDRSANTLASWLKQHGQEVTTVSRDRSGAYADGIRAGAPEAEMVADRWHLMVNASDALRQVLDRHQRQLREAAQLCASHDGVPLTAWYGGSRPRHKPSGNGQSSTSTGRRGYEEEARLQRAGVPIRLIARQLGMARNVVRRWLRAGEATVYRRAPGQSTLDRHLGISSSGAGPRGPLQRRRSSGASCEEQGFDGGYDVVRRWAIRRRALDAAVNSRTRRDCRRGACRPAGAPRASSPRTPAKRSRRADRRFVDTLTTLSP